jgi:hypothetical protein
MTVIPKRLIKLIDYVYEYVGDATNDWFAIKREIVNIFPPKDRSKFSKRHYSTKKHILNDFDQEVITYWEKISGNKIYIDESKLHSKDWVQKPKGWGIEQYNEQKRQQKETSKSN